MFDSLVVLNAIVLISEMALEDWWGLDITQCNGGVLTMCWIQFVILIVFVVELTFKILGFGLARFWRSTLNRIDFLAIAASLVFVSVWGPGCGEQECKNGLVVYSNHTIAEGNIKSEDGRVVLADAGNASNIITLLRLIRIFRLMRVLRSVSR